MSPAATIFISYRRQQAAGHAGRLYDGLAEHFGSERVFMDIAMEAGVDFGEQINLAVGACDALVLVVAPGWEAVSDERGARRLDDPADVHRLEIEAALRRDVRVIPALVQGATMPREAELPAALATLARRQAVDLSDQRWTYDVARLVTVLERVLDQAETGGATGAGRRPGVLAGGRRLVRRGAHRAARVFGGHPWRVFAGGVASGLALAVAVLAVSGAFAAPLLSIGFVNPTRFARVLKATDDCRVQIRSRYTIKTVDFVLDGDNPIIQERDPPFGCDNTSRGQWNTCVSRGNRPVSPGAHRLTATVTDHDGNTSSTSTTVHIPASCRP